MIAPTAKTINLLCLCLIVPSLLYSLITQWSLPLKNGRGFFLGVAVAPGFYEGPESRWLARYHTLLVTLNLIIFSSLAGILAIAQWGWIPIWAGSTALISTASIFAFVSWARYRLGTNPPILRAALSLQPRRLGEYLKWPVEILCMAVVGCSWWMLLRQGAGHFAWQGPVCLTWAVLGLLPGKITVVRQGWPLPADGAAEHHAAQEAARRYSVRMMDATGWFCASILFAGALRSVWPAARTVPTAQWLVLSVPFAFAVYLMVVIGRQRRVLEMGRTLRPAGSWAPRSGRATMWSRAGLIWFAVWFGGLMLMAFFFRG